MKDLYATLGVTRSATAEDIKLAYRRLAMQHHPDRGGDQARFQEIQEAYAVLSDPQQRAQYDRPPQQQINMNWQAPPGFQDIFSTLFGQHMGGHHQRRGHVRLELWISLEDAARGGRRTVSIGTAGGVNTVDIDVPLAINDGDHVQYPQLAPGGQDLVVTYRVQPHPVWNRSGLDLSTTRHVVIWDLILGSEIAIEDIHGNLLTARVPPRTQPGTKLRLRGRGMRDAQNRTGDVLLQLQARLPDHIPESVIAAIQQARE